MTDILDDYAQSPRPRGTLTAEYVYWNSGHRLLSEVQEIPANLC